MTNLREKAREVYAAGVEERGNWTPPAVPKKLYGYWARHRPDKAPVRENFCHFWRVVMIWTPLWFVANTVVRVLTSRVFHVMMGIAVAVSLVMLWGMADYTWIPFAILGVLAYVVAGVAATVIYFDARTQEFAQTRREKTSCIVVMVVTLPVSAFIWAMYGLVMGICAFTRSRAGAATSRMLRDLAPWIFGALALGAISMCAWTWGSIVVIGAIAAGVGAFALGRGFAMLATWIQGRRKIKREERARMLIDHEEFSGDSITTSVEREPREPGRIAKFFTGVGDMIIFAAQVARVKKWKICPMVTITEETQ